MGLFIMKKVYNNLYVGSDNDCVKFKGAIVHACQSCFVRGVHGNIGDKKVFEINNNLYLNLLDISSLSFEYAFPMIKRSMEFIDEHIKDMEVLVHCNFGMSRITFVLGIFTIKMSKKKEKSRKKKIFTN